jgi:hypothetical protein
MEDGSSAVVATSDRSDQAAVVWSVDEARRTASGTAAQGAPWLIAFSLALTVVAVLSFAAPVEIAVLAAVFQGGLALPLAFALERVLGSGPMSTEHPLRSLSVQWRWSRSSPCPR